MTSLSSLAADQFTHAAEALLAVQYSMLEEEILYHWERYAPLKRATIVSDHALRKTVRLYAASIRGVQKGLEDSGIERSLARMEAWNQIMRNEDDDAEEVDMEEDWGPWREDYLNLLNEKIAK